MLDLKLWIGEKREWRVQGFTHALYEGSVIEILNTQEMKPSRQYEVYRISK